jgi:predicted AlkP superfamily pyrophosphatase or phosphodiesterase
MPARPTLLFLLSLFVGTPLLAAEGAKPMLLLVSIDGLKPEAVINAEQHGLLLPNLRALMTDGVYSDGVQGVLPTVTYPSHTTMLTGASPARHGIYANTTFDPTNKNAHGWYWYAEDIKLPTLWDAAAEAGLVTANVYWPVSVGANIRYNLPQIWRTGLEDDLKLQRALSTPGLEQELSAKLGRYPGGMEEEVKQDEERTAFAIKLLETKHPNFMTLYLSGLDTEEHKSGPDSEDSNQVLQRLDRLVGDLRTSFEHVSARKGWIAVVSDHGFAKVEHDVNLYAAFAEAGLLTLDADKTITGWRAMPWPAGGSAAIMLRDPKDETTRSEVAALLARLQSDPESGVERVLTARQIERLGGFPDAAFYVNFKIGYELGYGYSGLIAPPANKGMHGYLADMPEMRSAFFLIGPGVPRGKRVSDMDMRQIAPTLASLLHVKLPGAERAPISFDRKGP